jgi:hypothetical protein
MKKALLFLCVLLTVQSFAYSKYWIQFTDKSNSPYSVSNPSVYLSPRSIQRRQNQNIPVIQRDLPPNPSYIQQVLATGAVTLNYRSRWFNAISITTTDANALTAINNLPFVQSVTPVKRMRGNVEDEHTFYDDPELRMGPMVQPQSYNYGASFGQINQIAGDCLHNQGFHGEGMVIAVLDAGFLNIQNLDAFDSLFANNQILGTWDFVAGDANVYDDDAHGEMVLSCMGGYLDGQIVGTAPKAKYWLLRTEDAPSEYVIEEDNWVAGAEFADSVGADVINTSLGYTTFDDNTMDHTYANMDGNTCVCSIAADYAVATGIFVTCSAGNSGSSSWFYIGAPADADSVLSVGAVNLGGTIAGFSSHGPTSDGRIKPDVSACGNGATVADQSNGINTGANGTSFSSPITCGAVACLWQAHPTMTNRQLYYAIIQSATQYTTPDNDYGYGIPNFCNASLILSGTDPSVFTGDQLVSLYPNPFADAVSFGYYSVKEQRLRVQLVDVTGKVVMEESISIHGNSYNQERIAGLASLAPGLYLLNIVSSDKVFTERIVKQ